MESDNQESSENEEEVDQIYTLKYQQIEINYYMQAAAQNFHLKNLQQAIENYEKVISLLSEQDFNLYLTILINIGVCHFQNTDYKQAKHQFEQTYSILLDQNINDQYLEIRLLANLWILNLQLNEMQSNQKISDTIFQIINQSNEKKNLIEFTIFVFFQINNISKIESLDFNFEDYYQGLSLACLYQSLGIKKELLNDYEQAMFYFKKSLIIWQDIGEQNFMLISLKHIITLYEQLNIQNDPELQICRQLFDYIIQSEQFKGINPDFIFKNFDQKIINAQKLTNDLKSMEENQDQTLDLTSNNKTMMIMNQNGEPIYIQALKLRLCKSIRIISNMMLFNDDHQLQQGLEQMQVTYQMIQEERNPFVELKLRQMQYTKESVDLLKASVNKIRKFMSNLQFGEAFFRIKQYLVLKINVIIEQSNVKEILKKNQYYNNLVLIISKGDYLIKVNFNGSGRNRKFFMVTPDIIKWAQNFKDINSSDKATRYLLSEVRGIVYGKCSITFRKHYNTLLETWLCFSIILSQRTLDIYCQENQIKSWILGISAAVNAKNPKAVTLTLGKYLWKKMYFLMDDLYLVPLREKKYMKSTFTKAILEYSYAISE